MIFGWPSTADKAMRVMLPDLLDFERRAQFEHRWSWWPRRCYRTGRWAWGPAVRAESVWTGPGEPVIERRWMHRHEALVMMLKRNENGHI